MKKWHLIVGFLLLMFSGIQAQETKIKWMTWQEAITQSQTEKKKIMVDVYTEWCAWCKRMEEGVFQQPALVKYINENFYPVKLNAETKEELIYNDKTYRYVRDGKLSYHELAAELLSGRLSFPSIVFLDDNLKVIQSINGYKTPVEFEQIVTYFAKDHHRTTPWSTYQKNFKSQLVVSVDEK